MSLQVQLRRGTSSQNASFVGRAGELIYTTDTKKLFVHDGTTAGGTEIGSLSSLATVATSGSYNDLSNLPTLFSGSYNDLTDTPTIPSAYTHPNHSGDVTSVGDGATTISNGVVNSDKLSTTLDFGSIA
jgi:hypothetical protein